MNEEERKQERQAAGHSPLPWKIVHGDLVPNATLCDANGHRVGQFIGDKTTFRQDEANAALAVAAVNGMAGRTGGGFDRDFHAVLDRLGTVGWKETAFEDLEWYYAEEWTYVLKCKEGDANEHFCIIRAKSADEAISKAVFDLHKSGEDRRKPGDAARMRAAFKRLHDFWAAHGKAYAVREVPNAGAIEELRHGVMAAAEAALAEAWGKEKEDRTAAGQGGGAAELDKLRRELAAARGEAAKRLDLLRRVADELDTATDFLRRVANQAEERADAAHDIIQEACKACGWEVGE